MYRTLLFQNKLKSKQYVILGEVFETNDRGVQNLKFSSGFSIELENFRDEIDEDVWRRIMC